MLRPDSLGCELQALGCCISVEVGLFSEQFDQWGSMPIIEGIAKFFFHFDYCHCPALLGEVQADFTADQSTPDNSYFIADILRPVVSIKGRKRLDLVDPLYIWNNRAGSMRGDNHLRGQFRRQFRGSLGI